MANDDDDPCQCPSCTAARAAGGDSESPMEAIVRIFGGAAGRGSFIDGRPRIGGGGGGGGRPGGFEFLNISLPGDEKIKPESGDAEYDAAKGKVENFLLKTSHDLTWDDVIGQDRAKAALKEVIEEPHENAELYKFYGRKPTRGAMLFGPPGTGKTMLAKAASAALTRTHGKEAGVMIKISASEVESPYVGKCEETIRNIFAFARAYKKAKGAPLLIFVDEADALLPSRESNSLPWIISRVSTFLSEMDGIEESSAFVLLATNRPSAIDTAALRDGRCDRKIRVDRPDRDDAFRIVLQYLAGVPTPDALTHLAGRAAAALWGDHQIGAFTVMIDGEVENHPVLLRHIINGAMVVGMVERAKGIAFRRDKLSGSMTGVGVDDIELAVAEIVRENGELDHSYIMPEFMAELVQNKTKEQRLKTLN